MSFYMTHMLAYMLFTSAVPGVTDDIDWPAPPMDGSGSTAEELPFDPSAVCTQADFNLCWADLNVTVPDGWESYEGYCNACIQAWLFGGMPLLRGIWVPGAMATALVVGWFLMRCVFLRHLYTKTNTLPRQARDKHRENSKKGSVFITTVRPEPVLAHRLLSQMATKAQTFAAVCVCMTQVGGDPGADSAAWRF
jgi:hypothetical protein